MDDSTLNEALALAEKGIPVFPCPHGKKTPATPRGFKDATTDPEQIREWFAEGGRNLAFPTGKVSGIIVIDWDIHKPGAEDAWARLVERLGKLEVPSVFRLPRAGAHATCLSSCWVRLQFLRNWTGEV